MKVPSSLSSKSARGGRILIVPGGPEPDPEVDAHIAQLEIAVVQISRPFRHKTDTETDFTAYRFD